MTTPVLDLDGRVVDRRQELTELRAAVEAAGTRRRRMRPAQWALLGWASQRSCRPSAPTSPGATAVFAYGRYRDGAPAPYSALGDALGSIVRTMEATGPAERDRWRADLDSEMSTLAGVLVELVPDLAQVLGATPHVA